MDADQDPNPLPPSLEVRWLHLGTPYLDLSCVGCVPPSVRARFAPVRKVSCFPLAAYADVSTCPSLPRSRGTPVAGPAQAYAPFTKRESEEMEHQWQTTLSEDEQAETRTKNPSLEDIAREKATKDKIDAAKAKAAKAAAAKGGKKTVVHVNEEEEEADELAHREEERKREIELEAKKAETAEEIEREESKVGVPVAKVSRLPCAEDGGEVFGHVVGSDVIESRAQLLPRFNS